MNKYQANVRTLESLLADYQKLMDFTESDVSRCMSSVLSAHKEWLTSREKGKCANLKDCYLARVQLQGADLSFAHLEGAYLRGANLAQASLQGAHLEDADLSWALLRDTRLSDVDLRKANLEGANLCNANLRRANLQGANLHEAELGQADLSYANLMDADLSYANLSRADLGYATLSGANLEGTILEESSLEGANLSNVSGLLDPVQWMKDNFEQDSLGFVVYKRLGETDYGLPDYWKIEAGSFLEEVVNPLPTLNCGCGVNFGTWKWCLGYYEEANLWRCRIRWMDLVSVVVPYNTCGKARCGRLELIAQIEDKGTEGWDE